MWKIAVEVAALVGLPAVLAAVRKTSYAGVKDGDALSERRIVKEDVRAGLKGWIRNTGDEEFSIGVAEE
jgi:tRNA-specific adenosine deaminase 1